MSQPIVGVGSRVQVDTEIQPLFQSYIMVSIRDTCDTLLHPGYDVNICKYFM